MGSLPVLSSTATISSQFSSLPTFFGEPPHFSTRTPPTQPHHLEVSCNAKNDQETSSPQAKFDRRNLLMGIGGVYGAANLVSSADSPAFAAALGGPISGPDLSKCSTPTDLNTDKPLDNVNCCPPVTTEIIDYKLPPVSQMRCRTPAHLANEEYISKLETAISLMKALPNDDPRNFMQQANVHCAYCNLAYPQTGDPNVKLQIHLCWHFFPWHRWYLYFYERILGKLICDPTFALPFWNWDNPPGMPMPSMFVKDGSPLFDPRRNPKHLPPALVDLKYSKSSPTDPSKIISSNLTEMYGEMIRNASTLEDFYGHKYVVGTEPGPGAGTVERGSHTAVHAWVGEDSVEGLDMGNFYSASRDPIFYAHHGNVDRLWSIWRCLRGSKPNIFDESDWLNASYLFYDENKQLVRVYVKDALDHEKMGYTYQWVKLPWLTYRPAASVKKSKIATTGKAPETIIFPVKLDKVVKVLVDRPKRKRSKEEKEKEEELLVIEGIEVDTAKALRFEVYVNDEDDKPGELIDKAEYAGCFAQLPHKKSVKVKSKIRLGLTELLEDLDVEDDDKILVSLVPKTGGEDISIGGIKIIYVHK